MIKNAQHNNESSCGDANGKYNKSSAAGCVIRNENRMTIAIRIKYMAITPLFQQKSGY